MPWLALPYTDDETKMVLKQMTGTNGIPALAIVTKESKIVVADASDEIVNRG